jgi:uncharacterized protein (TIGR02246 family)
VDEQRIAALVGEVERAWNAHDMSRFGACFAEDADFINVRGWWWRGRGEIERNHALLHETIFNNSSMELERASTREVRTVLSSRMSNGAWLVTTLAARSRPPNLGRVSGHG